MVGGECVICFFSIAYLVVLPVKLNRITYP